MAGVAQVWLTEDELDIIVKALVRYIPRRKGPVAEDYTDPNGMRTRQAVLDKLRPLAYGVSCEVSSEGGTVCNMDAAPLGACPGDLATELK